MAEEDEEDEEFDDAGVAIDEDEEVDDVDDPRIDEDLDEELDDGPDEYDEARDGVSASYSTRSA